jgi:hypothetical protein
MAIVDPVVSMPQVRAGTIKAYGVTTKTRLLSAPDIPTLDEAGLPGFDIAQWHGLWLPKGTPKNIIAKVNAAAMEAVADPKVRARLADLGQEIFPRDGKDGFRLGPKPASRAAKEDRGAPSPHHLDVAGGWTRIPWALRNQNGTLTHGRVD